MIKEFFSEISVFHSILFRFCIDSGGDRCLIVAKISS